MSDPVGITEIAQRTGVQPGTVMQWRDRHPQDHATPWPKPRWTVGGRPAWDWEPDIVPWLTATGRMPRERPAVATYTDEGRILVGDAEIATYDADGGEWREPVKDVLRKHGYEPVGDWQDGEHAYDPVTVQVRDADA